MISSIKCTLNDKEYGYEYLYYETTGEIKEAGGDYRLVKMSRADKSLDAYDALDTIDIYVQENGGTCIISAPVPSKE